MKEKVLFLTHTYPPKKFPRAIQISHLVQYLREHMNLRVVTHRDQKNIDASSLEFTPLDNVDYANNSQLIDFLDSLKGSRIKKEIFPDAQYLYHFPLLKKAEEILKQTSSETIVTFGQPMSTHIAGLKLKKKFPHIKWIAHFSDPWVDNSFTYWNRWLKFINKHYQDKVFETADRLIFTSEDTIDLVMRNYSSDVQSKATYLPHCFNKKLYPATHKNNTQFQIRYLGNFYGKRQPDSFLRALDFIPNKLLEKIKIEFIGNHEHPIEKFINSEEVKKIVTIKPPVDYLCSLKLMKESDLLLVIDAPADISPFLPSKLIDYVGANQPIFGITPAGAAQRLIQSMKFITVSPENPEKIAEGLESLIKCNRNKFVPVKIYEQYSVEKVGKKMLQLLNSL